MTPIRGMKVGDEQLREMAISHGARLVIDDARRSGVLRPDEGPELDREASMAIAAIARDRGVNPSLEQATTEAVRLMADWHTRNAPQEGSTCTCSPQPYAS